MNENILLVEDQDALRLRPATAFGVRDTWSKPRKMQRRVWKVDFLSFDLLIVDVMLPYRSVFGLCQDTRQQGLATPILFLTTDR